MKENIKNVTISPRHVCFFGALINICKQYGTVWLIRGYHGNYSSIVCCCKTMVI